MYFLSRNKRREQRYLNRCKKTKNLPKLQLPSHSNSQSPLRIPKALGGGFESRTLGLSARRPEHWEEGLGHVPITGNTHAVGPRTKKKHPLGSRPRTPRWTRAPPGKHPAPACRRTGHRTQAPRSANTHWTATTASRHTGAETRENWDNQQITQTYTRHSLN